MITAASKHALYLVVDSAPRLQFHEALLPDMVDHQSIFSIREVTVSESESHELGFRKTAFRFIAHSTLATIGGMAIGFLLLGFVPLRPIGPHWRLITLLFDAPYTPAFWGSSFLLGLIVNRRMADRSACWVGPAGLILLGVIVVVSGASETRPGYQLKQY